MTLFTGMNRSLAVFALLAILSAALAYPNSALAVVRPQYEALENTTFPKAWVVRKQVRFWEKIFYRYPSSTVIVHESDDTDRIIDVIDYKHLNLQDAKDTPVPRKEREEVTKKYLKRYTKAVERFAKEGKAALGYGAIEKRVYAVYQNNPKALQKLLGGAIKIRAQTGLADDFRAAAATAQAYLPYMEKVFSQYGLPLDITRLAFVESMFNVRAVSKVGASGIWQFMPDTARNFIFVNKLVDERNSPFKATRAAAQMLLDDYRDLGSWPLAITAYNHGKQGVTKAIRQLGTKDFGRIVLNYESPSFGFASKNYYAEFIAALHTYERLAREKRIGAGPALPEAESVILQKPTSVAQILHQTQLSQEELAELNPCILATTFTVNQHKPLPAYYEIRVPKAKVRTLKMALLGLKPRNYATRPLSQKTLR